MKCYIVESFLGFLAYDEDLKVIASKPFNEVEDAVKELVEFERYGSSPSLESLLKDLLEMGCDSIIVEDEGEAKALKAKYNVQIQVISPSAAGKVFRA
ncbi:MAG: hypothetical protein QXP27_09075, partial [Candidatus Methanomethyliaceae archaeon]